MIYYIILPRKGKRIYHYHYEYTCSVFVVYIVHIFDIFQGSVWMRRSLQLWPVRRTDESTKTFLVSHRVIWSYLSFNGIFGLWWY